MPRRPFRDRWRGAQARATPTERPPDSTLNPDGIAQTYLEILRQPRSAWSLEVELRPMGREILRVGWEACSNASPSEKSSR